MLDTRQAPNGDLAAIVACIEREQPARAMRPQRLPLPGVGVASSIGSGSRARAGVSSDAPSQRPPVAAADPAAARSPTGALIGAAIGAALLAFGLMAEGGVFLVLVGAALLWHSLRNLRRAASDLPSPAQRVENAFGHGRPKASRRSNR